MAMPHLGGWEWSGFWVTQVKGYPVTAVVEELEPRDLFEWFVELRRSFGFEVVALGPDAGAATVRALKANHVLALLCDRDLAGTGPEVEFFGERTTLPGGPATLAPAHRRAASCPPPSTSTGPTAAAASCCPPLDTTRQGKLRDDVQRVTQDLAHALEDLIRRAPEQWHLLQPNWPSATGQAPYDPPYRGCASAWSAPTRLTIPGGVQGQVLGLARSLRAARPRGAGARARATGRRPTPGVTPARPQRPDRRQRLGRPARPDPSAQLRTIRALRDEDFDVLHLHEPMAPGPCVTALLFGRRPEGRHVPRGGGERRLPLPAAGA